MLRKRSQVLKNIAITKYMIIGAVDELLEPAMANMTNRIKVISNPDNAVPTVNFDTTD